MIPALEVDLRLRGRQRLASGDGLSCLRLNCSEFAQDEMLETVDEGDAFVAVAISSLLDSTHCTDLGFVTIDSASAIHRRSSSSNHVLVVQPYLWVDREHRLVELNKGVFNRFYAVWSVDWRFFQDPQLGR